MNRAESTAHYLREFAALTEKIDVAASQGHFDDALKLAKERQHYLAAHAERFTGEELQQCIDLLERSAKQAETLRDQVGDALQLDAMARLNTPGERQVSQYQNTSSYE